VLKFLQLLKTGGRKRKCACVILCKDSGTFKTKQQEPETKSKEEQNGSQQGAARFVL